MTPWRKRLQQFGHQTEEHFDRLKYALEARLGQDRPVQIVAYLRYGTRSTLELAGRLIRNKGLSAADDNDTVWENLLQMYKRMESDEIPGATITATFQDHTLTTVTDDEGYFRLALPQAVLPDDDKALWVAVALETEGHDGHPVQATAQILIPPDDAAFGVISDIDDTIIRTGAANLLEMVRNTFLHNARTRLPFPGVGAFYTALNQGRAGRPFNPVFYVSNGPWNLFDFLVDFIRLNGLPQGPVLLRDYGFDANKFIKDDTHKIRAISTILETYPHLPFVLIGDSGEHDPEIYHHIVQHFPGRILAVYIRDVTTERRDAGVARIAAEVAALGPDMLLLEDTTAAAEHAAHLGLIDAEAVAAVKQAVP